VTPLDFESTTDGKFRMRFKRLLDTGDEENDMIIRLDEEMTVIWAYSSSNPGSESFAATAEKHDVTGVVLIDFKTGKVTSVDDGLRQKQLAHGVMMFFGWCVLFPAALFVARYYKKQMQHWFYLHVLLVSAGALFVIIAFGIAVEMVKGTGSEGFTTKHSRLGVLVFLVMFLQCLLGIIAHLKYIPTREAVPLFPDRLHWYTGRVVVILAMTNCLMGLYLFESGAGMMIALIVYLLSLVGIAKMFERLHKESQMPISSGALLS
jgi:hypothetical protein